MGLLRLVQRLQLLDRRIIYLVLVVVLSFPFFLEYALPVFPDTYTKRTFDSLEGIASDPANAGKLVFVLTNWGPGTSGENRPQYEVLMRHLLRRRLKFMFVTTADDPVFIESAELGLRSAMHAEQRRAYLDGEPVPEWTYGVDYLNLGIMPAPAFASVASSLITRTLQFVPRDYVQRKPLTADNFPLLAGFRGVADIALVLVVSAGDEASDVCGIVQSQVPTLKVATATMGIVANDLYPLVKSGQLCGLINSARGAAEYLSLLDPGSPTSAVGNSMSLGKIFLLLLVIVGNVAFLVSRRAERRGRLAPLALQTQPLPPLPKKFLVGLFIALMIFYLGASGVETARLWSIGTVPRERVASPDDDPALDYPRYERVSRQTLQAEQLAALPGEDAARQQRAARLADREFAQFIELRIGEFLAALLTLGVLAFLLGDNRFYRFTEAIIIGSTMAYFLVEKWELVLKPLWFQPIRAAALPGGNRWDLFWLLLLIPGSLWYFVHSKRYRWLNQVVVALFIGFAVGPEFEKQIGLIVPQVIDTIRPVWPIVPDAATGAAVFSRQRCEHLVFVVVLVLSLLYFVFFLRPRTGVGRGVMSAGRLAMMVGFGAMFGNTVNTRLSWLAPRIGFLIDDWLGKLVAP